MTSLADAGAPTVGVVGPLDLVSSIGRLAAREYPQLHLRPYAYGSEGEAIALVRGAEAEVDAWLFTGVVPFSLAWQSGALGRPATYVRYRGTALPRVLRPLLAACPAPGTISIDTLPRQQVYRTLRRVGLPGERVRVFEHRPDRAGDEFVRFHRRAARDRAGSVAITCVRSVYDELTPAQPTVRLVPALSAVRAGLGALAPETLDGPLRPGDPVVGLLELSDPAPELPQLLGDLAAASVRLSATRHLLVSTRERLVATSEQFRRLRLLDDLRPGRVQVRLGFGIADTVIEAEHRARHALARARTIGAFAAVVSPAADAELVIGSATTPTGAMPPVPLAVAQRRTGLPVTALRRLEGAAAASTSAGLTASDVATALGLEPRAARRTVQRLAAAGVVQPLGAARAGTVGRPRAVYRVTLA